MGQKAVIYEAIEEFDEEIKCLDAEIKALRVSIGLCDDYSKSSAGRVD